MWYSVRVGSSSLSFRAAVAARAAVPEMRLVGVHRESTEGFQRVPREFTAAGADLRQFLAGKELQLPGHCYSAGAWKCRAIVSQLFSQNGMASCLPACLPVNEGNTAVQTPKTHMVNGFFVPRWPGTASVCWTLFNSFLDLFNKVFNSSISLHN